MLALRLLTTKALDLTDVPEGGFIFHQSNSSVSYDDIQEKRCNANCPEGIHVETTTGSPWIDDCLQIVENIKGGGSWYVYLSSLVMSD